MIDFFKTTQNFKRNGCEGVKLLWQNIGGYFEEKNPEGVAL